MKSFRKYLFLGTFAFVAGSQLNAQTFDDWEARPSFTATYRISNKWSVAETYYHYLNHDLKKYDKSVLGTKVEYKILPSLKARIDYRLGFEKGGGSYHDIRYALQAEYTFAPRWTLTYRPTLQQKMSKGASPEYFLRNRMKLGYDLSPQFELFLFTENYQALDHGLSFSRQKSSLGAAYSLDPRNALELRFTVLNYRRHKTSGIAENKARLALNYSFTFGKVD